MARRLTPKHRAIFQALHADIQSGRRADGERLPSEAALGRTFRASRITVTRAVRDLQQLGLVRRRAGSGTYVTTAASVAAGMSFGLLIPDSGRTEILEPLCHGMLEAPEARTHTLLRGSPGDSHESAEARAWHTCQLYIERKADGVFFAPLDGVQRAGMNARITAALDAASIPVVLLDRAATPYPQRGHHDLVGIDHRRAGHQITEHLLRFGARRIAFAAPAEAGTSADAREAGYREALYQRGTPAEREFVVRLDPADPEALRALIDDAQPDGIVAADDWTAARLMRTMLDLGIRVPNNVRLVGIDDADYARTLPVPLTTLRQPAREIGAAALAVMLDRLARPQGPVRDLFLQTKLIVRESCGARPRNPV